MIVPPNRINDARKDRLCESSSAIGARGREWFQRIFQSVMLREPVTKIAFLHIPKTAGIFVIDAFRGRLGPVYCVAFSNVEISEESFRGKRFVSGHVYLGDIHADAFIFNFLREPLKQIASHLMWVDHYNLPDYRHEASHFHCGIKTAIESLARTDLSDARSINRYLEWLPSDSRFKDDQPPIGTFGL